ncbi:hypothetical protein [Caballeronia hypogeia]|nr:hypothetical protein [Caballeronia hypogeia]
MEGKVGSFGMKTRERLNALMQRGRETRHRHEILRFWPDQKKAA